MKLMTKEIHAALPPLYSQEDKEEEAIAVVKFFDPTGSWTWYASEGSLVCPGHSCYDCQECSDKTQWTDFLFFGLVFGAEVEYGNFSLKELVEWPGRFGLGIERDVYWKPRTFREVKELMGRS